MSSHENDDPAQIAMRIRMANGQTADAFVVETYAGTDVFKIDKDGDITAIGDFALTGALSVTGAYTHTGDLAVVGNLSVSVAATLPAITGPTSVTGNLSSTTQVSAPAIVASVSMTTPDLAVTDDLTVTDEATLPKITGPTTLTGVLTQNGNIGLTGNLTQTGNQVVTGNVDISGEFFAKGAMPPADYVVMLDGSTYKAFSCRTGDLLTSSATYATVYAAALAALTSGTGVIIDMTDGMGPGPTVNRYNSGVLYDPAFVVEHKVGPVELKTFTNFDEGYGSWTKTGTGVFADDSTNTKAGSKSLMITSYDTETMASIVQAFNALPKDAHSYLLRAYVDDYTKLLYCMFNFWNSGRTLYHRVYLNPNTAFKVDFDGGTGRWMTWVIPSTAFGGSLTDLTTIAELGVTACATSGQTVNVSFDTMKVFPRLNPRGVVIIRFDDADTLVSSNAKYVMDKYGWKGMFHWIAGTYESQYAGVKKLRDTGWDICNHTATHQDWPMSTLNACMTEVIKCQRLLAKHGCLGRVRHFGPPGGTTNHQLDSALHPYFHFQSLGDRWPLFQEFAWPPSDPFAMASYGMEGKSLATAQTRIDTLETNQEVLMLVFHGLGGGGQWTTADFTSLMAYIATKDVEVLTVSQLYEKYGMAVKERSVVSGTFAIDSTGVKTVTTEHGLGRAPAIHDVAPFVIENTAVDDWAYDWVKVTAVSATQITAKVKVGTASGTGSATAKLGFKVGIR